jgi:hypothetical protein
MRCRERRVRGQAFGYWVPRVTKRSESCSVLGCNKPRTCSEPKPSRWCETTRAEPASGWYRAHETRGWKPGSGKGPLQARRMQDVHADEFHDRRMLRGIPADWGFPEGEGKIKRDSRHSICMTPASPVSRQPLKSSAATRNGMRGAAKTNERQARRVEALGLASSRVRPTP